MLPFDPGDRIEAGLSFVGVIRSDWSRGDCPRNIARARETGRPARIELRPGYAAALEGLETGQAIIVIGWLHGARRDLARQVPRHAGGPRGTFALRSPVRPNPLSLSVCRITWMERAAGQLGLDAIDLFDRTPVVDLKPWLPGADIPPEAHPG
nr:TrmO family methyltransferase [Mangrovicoccus algicola]